MAVIFENQIDPDQPPKLEILSHVGKEASELEELVFYSQAHPFFKSSQIRKDLFPDSHEPCFHFEYGVDLCVKVILSLVLVITSCETLAVNTGVGVIFLEEIVDDLVGAETVSKLCSCGEILCHGRLLFVQSHLVEVQVGTTLILLASVLFGKSALNHLQRTVIPECRSV